MQVIKPSIGRVVLYYNTNLPAPLPALICHVHSDTVINVAAFDSNGAPLAGRYPTTSVRLVQPGESPAPSDPYCEWPPMVPASVVCMPGKSQQEIDRLTAGICILCGINPSVKLRQPHCQSCSDKIREENVQTRLKRATAAQRGDADITDKPS